MNPMERLFWNIATPTPTADAAEDGLRNLMAFEAVINAAGITEAEEKAWDSRAAFYV